MFNFKDVDDVFWDDIILQELPVYLTDNIERIRSVTNKKHQNTEAFSRAIIDQILISSIYEENKAIKSVQTRPSAPPQEDPATLSLQYETKLEKEVIYEGEKRLLSGAADYTLWYAPCTPKDLSTNLIIIEAKKTQSADSCLGQIAAYMGIIHSLRKEEAKQNSVVYGVITDGLAFRFCRVDSNSRWSTSRLLEWRKGDGAKIYSAFRSLIRIAALSSPSTSPIKNPNTRVITAFKSSASAIKYDFGLSSLKFEEMDEEEWNFEELHWPEDVQRKDYEHLEP